MSDPDLLPAESIHRRAALFTWISGVVLLLLSTCCVGSMLALAAMPLDEVRQMDREGQLPAEAWDQLKQIKPYLPTAAAVLAVVGILPAAALIVLGFGVRRGKRGMTTAAWVIAWVALGLTGLNLLLSLPAVATTGASGLINLLPSVALAALLWWTVRWLAAARAVEIDPDAWDAPDAPGDGVDPWDRGY
jgi:hypothetical protein